MCRLFFFFPSPFLWVVLGIYVLILDVEIVGPNCKAQFQFWLVFFKSRMIMVLYHRKIRLITLQSFLIMNLSNYLH